MRLISFERSEKSRQRRSRPIDTHVRWAPSRFDEILSVERPAVTSSDDSASLRSLDAAAARFIDTIVVFTLGQPHWMLCGGAEREKQVDRGVQFRDTGRASSFGRTVGAQPL